MGASRRFLLLLVLTAAGLLFLFLTSFQESDDSRHPATIIPAQVELLDDSTLSGHAIAPKLGNATAKAELGRAAWKVLHTTFARFPVKPTKDESEALRHGECAEHFGKILSKYPPQVSSRSAAATWGCYVHNIVNKRLHKPEFDCERIGDAYDCGCAKDGADQIAIEKPEMSEAPKKKAD